MASLGQPRSGTSRRTCDVCGEPTDVREQYGDIICRDCGSPDWGGEN